MDNLNFLEPDENNRKKSLPDWLNTSPFEYRSTIFDCKWTDEQMSRFLKQRGYFIKSRFNIESGNSYLVAFKETDDFIPDEKSNLSELFNLEIQEILLDWLLKLGKNEQ